MAGYSPLKITGTSTGLVQNRENFLLPDDAYPILNNAYVWRERILRKQGFILLGRLRRSVTVNNSLTAGGNINLKSALSLETTASIAPGTISLTGGTDGTLYTDPLMDGTLTATGGTGVGGTINYATGALHINTGGSQVLTGTIYYYPGLPVMGIRIRELLNSEVDQTVFFDQKYAYKYTPGLGGFEEFIPGTTWNAAGLDVKGTDFFWSTNYWTSSDPPFTVPPGTSGTKLFWVTNNSGHSGGMSDPPRITDGAQWIDFTSGTWHQLDATEYLWNWLSMLPFRGRMVTFNTWEGTTAALAVNNRQRIRWSTIGNPFIPFAAGPPATGSWRSDIRGQGGYLDIPTAEDIVAVGFVRDNLVIYCEKSTWQLRYTGRSISPFQIEKVNSELGLESPYSAVQFDTSLIGIGERGIVECDSYKAERIDIKIPDFVFYFNLQNNAGFRVQGIRDFEKRLAYWTIPLAAAYEAGIVNTNWIFPNIRLLYNYENDSWALFNDSFTALGNYQEQSYRTWINTPQPWVECNFTWIDDPNGDLIIVGGNQQGFIEKLDEASYNDVSLFISNIVGHAATDETTVIESPNHNLTSGTVIGISEVIGAAFSSLNGGVYGITVIDKDSFQIFTYSSTTDQFSDDVLIAAGTYIGGGLINIRDNFNITSKKFNFLDEGEAIQIGHIDILIQSSKVNEVGAFTLKMYIEYDDVNATNILPNNVINNGVVNPETDTFFNSVIPTIPSDQATAPDGTKFWQRIFCATRANFLTLQYTLSNAQMAGSEQQIAVQIDAQVLWIRKAGRISQL